MQTSSNKAKRGSSALSDLMIQHLKNNCAIFFDLREVVPDPKLQILIAEFKMKKCITFTLNFFDLVVRRMSGCRSSCTSRVSDSVPGVYSCLHEF